VGGAILVFQTPPFQHIEVLIQDVGRERSGSEVGVAGEGGGVERGREVGELQKVRRLLKLEQLRVGWMVGGERGAQMRQKMGWVACETELSRDWKLEGGGGGAC